MENQHYPSSSDEKRKHRRISTSNQVAYVLLDERGKKVHQGKGRTLNLSQSGALLETKEPLNGSFIILITFDVEGNHVQVKGNVAHTRKSDKAGFYLTGLRFVGSTSEQVKAIVTFVKAYYRSKHAVKVFVQPDNTATIYCRWCNKTKEMDVSRFKGHVNFRVKCSCGKTSKIQLEFRSQFRKKTELRGSYRIIDKGGKPLDAGVMTVVELSRKGVRMEIRDLPLDLEPGDLVHIRFTLDDKNQTRIDRTVIVKNIHPPYVGATFHRSTDTDNSIGYYLMG